MPDFTDDPELNHALWVLSLVLHEVAEHVGEEDDEQTKDDQPSLEEDEARE